MKKVIIDCTNGTGHGTVILDEEGKTIPNVVRADFYVGAEEVGELTLTMQIVPTHITLENGAVNRVYDCEDGFLLIRNADGSVDLETPHGIYHFDWEKMEGYVIRNRNIIVDDCVIYDSEVKE